MDFNKIVLLTVIIIVGILLETAIILSHNSQSVNIKNNSVNTNISSFNNKGSSGVQPGINNTKSATTPPSNNKTITTTIATTTINKQSSNNTKATTTVSSSNNTQTTTVNNSESKTQSQVRTALSIPNITELNSIFRGSWSFLNQSNITNNLPYGAKSLSVINFTNATGYRINIIIITFNNTANASDAYNIESSSVNSATNLSVAHGALNFGYAYTTIGGKVYSANGKKTIIASSPFNKYIVSMDIYSETNVTLSCVNFTEKLIGTLNEIEIPKNLSYVLKLTPITSNNLKNVFGNNWTLTKESNIIINNSGGTHLFLENFSSPSGYNVSFYVGELNSIINASERYNYGLSSFNGATNISVLNGALLNNYAVSIVGGDIYNNAGEKIVTISGPFGKQVLGIGIYKYNGVINESLVAPGLIDLIEISEGINTSLIPNSTTKLATASNTITTINSVNYNSPLFITSNQLNTTIGGSWSFEKVQNITSNIPPGAKNFILENFTNAEGQTTNIGIGIFYNSSDASSAYTQGLQSLSSANDINLSINSFIGGAAYFNISGEVYGGIQPKNIIEGVSLDGNYLVEVGISGNASTASSFIGDTPSIKTLTSQLRNELVSQIAPITPEYITTQELSSALGGSWKKINETNITAPSPGIKYGIIENFSNSAVDYNVSMIILSMNSSSTVSKGYNNEITSYIKNGVSNNVTNGALENDYAFSIIGGNVISNQKGQHVILAESPYGSYIVSINIYSNAQLLDTPFYNGLVSLLQNMEPN